MSNESVEAAVDSVATSLLVEVEEKVRKGATSFRVAVLVTLALAFVVADDNSEALIQTLVSSQDMVARWWWALVSEAMNGTKTRAAGSTGTARSFLVLGLKMEGGCRRVVGLLRGDQTGPMGFLQSLIG